MKTDRHTPTPVETERRRRIRLTVAAFTYEYLSESVMSDGEFDRECVAVDLSVDTGRADLDEWWRKEFTPGTGMWIRRHPELGLVAIRAKQWLESLSTAPQDTKQG